MTAAPDTEPAIPRPPHWAFPELRAFLTAVMFYTRVPCPAWVDHDALYLNRATGYFPLIGLLLGMGAGLLASLGLLLLPVAVVVLLSMAWTIYLTGAFHEDGWADVCDGFGGGWSPAQILQIMQDSRLGTYGVLGLMLMLGLKFSCLLCLPAGALLPALVLGHTASRAFAASFIYLLPYARTLDAQGGKAKPLAVAPPWGRLLLAWAWVAVAAFSLPSLTLLAALPVLLLPGAYLYRMYQRRLGGYTGDCLGAAQQLGELTLYLAMLALPWP